MATPPPARYSADSSWLAIPPGSPFSLANLPFGIISTAQDRSHRPAVAIGTHALDLRQFTRHGGFSILFSMLSPAEEARLTGVFTDPAECTSLNGFAALGRPCHRLVRTYLHKIFEKDGLAEPSASNRSSGCSTNSGPGAAASAPATSDDKPPPAIARPRLLRDNPAFREAALIPLSQVSCHMPISIGDYTDFYAGIHHATNVGTLFRGRDKALQPNYRHLPVGYHGRASSVVVSGHPVRRPVGQIRPASADRPILAPTEKLDFELELGAFVCGDRAIGDRPVMVEDASENYLFGVVLLNDWSARDVQAWEYVPLGPFTSKNFATSISSWVVLMDALEPFVTTADAEGADDLLPYLQMPAGKPDKSLFDIDLQVELRTKESAPAVITRTSSRHLVFSFAQMLAHHTVTGCNIRSGDLLGSGTISGCSDGESSGWGSLLEQSRNGSRPVDLTDSENGETRTFLRDGDTVVLSGVCRPDREKPIEADENAYSLVGFGECAGTVLPAWRDEDV